MDVKSDMKVLIINLTQQQVTFFWSLMRRKRGVQSHFRHQSHGLGVALWQNKDRNKIYQCTSVKAFINKNFLNLRIRHSFKFLNKMERDKHTTGAPFPIPESSCSWNNFRYLFVWAICIDLVNNLKYSLSQFMNLVFLLSIKSKFI